MADAQGLTSKPGLLAIGEVACTGVHGANRLASNSLLEGLVFGINASDHFQESELPLFGTAEPMVPQSEHTIPDTSVSRKEIRRRMTSLVGVERNRDAMLKALEFIEGTPDIPPVQDREALISRNMRLVSKQVTLSAVEREESRGGHIRSDFPATDSKLDAMHQIVSPYTNDAGTGTVRWFGALHSDQSGSTH